MWLTFSAPPGQQAFGSRKKVRDARSNVSRSGSVGIVRVVGFKFPAAAGFRRAKQDDAMVDGHRREFHQVEDGQTILFERGGQCLRRFAPGAPG